MANPSPACEVQDGSGSYTAAAPNGVDVTPGNTITIRLSSQAEVESWQLSVSTTDDTSDKDTINAALSIDALTLTATFTAPAAGKVYRFRSQVNQGRSRDNTVQSTYATTFCIYTPINGRRCAAVDETTEGDANFGWVKWYNDLIRSMPTGAGVVWGGGGSPGGVTGAVQINQGSGIFGQASGTVYDSLNGVLSVGTGARLRRPFADGAVLGGTTVYTGTDIETTGLSRHKTASVLRQLSYNTGAPAQNVYTRALPTGSINNIFVEANAVPSGSGGIAGGSYVRRSTIFVNATGQATSSAMDLTYSNEMTHSGVGFTGFSIGTGIVIGHSGPNAFVGLTPNPTGSVQWGFTITVQSTQLS